MQHRVFTNDVKGYQSMLNWVVKQTKGVSVFYCFGNTGNYSLKLASYLSYKGAVIVELPLPDVYTLLFLEEFICESEACKLCTSVPALG